MIRYITRKQFAETMAEQNKPFLLGYCEAADAAIRWLIPIGVIGWLLALVELFFICSH